LEKKTDGYDKIPNNVAHTMTVYIRSEMKNRTKLAKGLKRKHAIAEETLPATYAANIVPDISAMILDINFRAKNTVLPSRLTIKRRVARS